MLKIFFLSFVYGSQIVFNQENTIVGSEFDFKSPLLKVSTDSENLVSSPWTTLSHITFPNYKLRIKREGTLCDTSVQQIVGYLDVDDKHVINS